MKRWDELALQEFLGGQPNFLSSNAIPELEKLSTIWRERGGVDNPYGISLQMLGGIANPTEVINYLSGVYSSTERRKAIDFIIWWVKTWIDQTLHRVLNSNWNALEWYILEMLIQTKIHEKSFFERPPYELDANFATDLIYSSPEWLRGGLRTLGIQITSTHLSSPRFQSKRVQIRHVNNWLQENQKILRQFGYKRPDSMAIAGIYGKAGDKVRLWGNSVFCHDLWLPLDEDPIKFKEDLAEETKDVADFLRMSIKTWNSQYPQRRKYGKLQKKRISGRDGDYIFEWKYIAQYKSMVFYLKKTLSLDNKRSNPLISYFEILDTK